ncbi:MAG: metallophosphoesterase family protein, partial [Actinomycetota bacterium]
ARSLGRRRVGLRPNFANEHARWMAAVAGTRDETGPLGWFFLQRIATFVDAYAANLLPAHESEALAELGGADAREVAQALAGGGLPPAPPPEWPSTAEVRPPGEVKVRFGIIGDPHVGVPIADRLLEAAVADLNRERLAFSVVLGDVTQNGREDSFMRARGLLDRLVAPSRITLGNHDMWGGDVDHPVGLGRFRETFQCQPSGLHEADGFRMILLNSADPAPSPFPPFDLARGGFTDDPNEAVPGGALSEETVEWMAGIEAGEPTFVVLHHPPYPYLGFPPIVFGLDHASTQALADFVERTAARAIFCGHTHRSAAYRLGKVPVIEVPALKEWPFGYGVVEAGERGWAFNLRPITDQRLVEEASPRGSLLFRRYARGPDEARAFRSPA